MEERQWVERRRRDLNDELRELEQQKQKVQRVSTEFRGGFPQQGLSADTVAFLASRILLSSPALLQAP